MSAAAGYTAAQLCRAARISRVTYDQWRARGFIASAQPPRGSGHPQRYSFEEVLQAAVLAALVALGISVREAKRASEILPATAPDRGYLLLTVAADGTPGAMVVPKRKVLTKLRDAESFAGVDLKTLEERLRAVLR